jgi:hypothetical protein
MTANWLALVTTALLIPYLGSSRSVGSYRQSDMQCDFAAWKQAHADQSISHWPVPIDSLDQPPVPSEWPTLEGERVPALAGWTWDATVEVVLDTSGVVQEIGLLALDVWRDEIANVPQGQVLQNVHLVRDSLQVLVSAFVGGIKFSPGVRQGIHVPTYFCPVVSASMIGTP